MSRIAFLILFSLFATVASAQQMPAPGFRETMATLRVSSGKGAHHYYLVYTANGRGLTKRKKPQWGWVAGSKYIIAYDTAHPKHINTYSFTKPIFDDSEKTTVSIAKVVRTNFGHDIRYGRQQTRWAEYLYYAPFKFKGATTLSPRFSVRFFPDDVAIDTNGITGQYFKVTYNAEHPEQSILLFAEKVIDTIADPGYTPKFGTYHPKPDYTEIVYPISFFLMNVRPNYNNFTLHFEDPNTSTLVNRSIHLPGSVQLYGGMVSVLSGTRYLPNHATYFSMINLAYGAANNTFYFYVGPSFGYQWQLSRRMEGYEYKLYPAIKAAVALNIGYGNFDYNLGEINSSNGGDLVVNKQSLHNDFSVEYTRRQLCVSPEVGLFIRCSKQLEFRFTTILTLEALHRETLLLSHGDLNTSTAIRDFLTDGSGNTITRDFFMPIPMLTFKIECAIKGSGR